MPSNNDDGTFDDRLDVFRRAFAEEGAEQEALPTPPPPQHIHSIALIAIDEFTFPTKWCRNGHVVQWTVDQGTPDEMTVAVVARYPREVLLTPPVLRDSTFQPTALCVTCGEEGVDAQETSE